MLGIPVEANASVADARIFPKNSRLTIQYNPTQPRARVRFSIAHEIAHTLFSDVAEEVRHRGGNRSAPDDWQLEVLCNVAAAEFVMPLGSMPPSERLPAIETLMIDRKQFDVSAEAFLIRSTKITSEPVVMFCASTVRTSSHAESSRYRIDYTVPSRTAPKLALRGRLVPEGSVLHACTAIGYTDRKVEDWFSQKRAQLECVGIPSYLGNTSPRVAGLIRFGKDQRRDHLKFVHGDVLDPRGGAKKIICQLVNDQARLWGGGLAKTTARKFPDAQRSFTDWFTQRPRSKRLGSVHLGEINEFVTVASLVAQEGFGASSAPRIRYAALEKCLEQIAEFAVRNSATVHMPRIGAGQSGGTWETVEEIVRSTFVPKSIPVTVYDPPPKHAHSSPGLFD